MKYAVSFIMAMKNIKIMKYVGLILIVLVLVLILRGRFRTPEEFRYMYSFGDTVVFDGMEITFTNNVEWIHFNNHGSTDDEYDAFRIPVKVTNIATNSNRITRDHFTIFGTNGVGLERTWWPIGYEDVTNMPRIRNGITFYSYMYFPYDGRGNYVIEFRRLVGWDNLEPVEVWIPIR